MGEGNQSSTMLLDLEHFVASLDLTHTSISTTHSPSPSDEFDEWEYWLQRKYLAWFQRMVFF